MSSRPTFPQDSENRRPRASRPAPPIRPSLKPTGDYQPPVKKRGGGGFGGFLLVLALLAAAGFGYAMFHFQESPQQVWKRIVDQIESFTEPAPTPAPTPSPIATPSPTPTPEPAPIST